MERLELVDGLTLETVLFKIAGGGRVLLTHNGVGVAVVVRPDYLDTAALDQTCEQMERDLATLMAEWERPSD